MRELSDRLDNNATEKGELSAKQWDSVSKELENLVLEIGALDPTDDTQILTAIQTLIANSANTLAKKLGDANNLFRVKNAVDGNDAVPLAQLTDILNTALTDVSTVTYSDVDPTQNTNPNTKNVLWVNTTSGEVFTCTDNTTDLNYWVGQLGTLIIPDLRVTIPVTTVAEWNDFFNLANPKAITYTAGLGFDNFQSYEEWKSNKVKFLEEFSCNITTALSVGGMDVGGIWVYYKDGTILKLYYAADSWDSSNDSTAIRSLFVNDATIYYKQATAEDNRVIDFVIDSANAVKEIDYISYFGNKTSANSQDVHNYVDNILFKKATLW